MPSSAYKKKLHAFRPLAEPQQVGTQRTALVRRSEPADPLSVERGVRELLAQKVSGTMVGVWLLLAEHLRLGTWDLLCGFSGRESARVEPRLALQMVHEAALGVSGVRRSRSLSQKGFELANVLPFVASDQAVHKLLEPLTVQHSRQMQIELGRLRRAAGHFDPRLVALDPHRLRSYSQRQMRRRVLSPGQIPVKALQTFFGFDVDTQQPLAMTLASSSRSVAQATPDLLEMLDEMLTPASEAVLLLADAEHFSAELFQTVYDRPGFDLLCPMARTQALQAKLAALPDAAFRTHWPGLASGRLPYRLRHSDAPLQQIVQRLGERPPYQYSAFLSTRDSDELDQLCRDYPQRWRIEEFFNAYQALGWKRAGTTNLNVRYAQMSLALVAQAAVDQLRKRLGDPFEHWEAGQFGRRVLQGLDGDVRVRDDTVVVTFYNPPHAERLRRHYENLPAKLAAEGVDPRLPWLYGFQLDFRFR